MVIRKPEKERSGKMKTLRIVLGVVVALAIVTSAAFAADEADQGRRRMRQGQRNPAMRAKILEKFDADGNGELSEEERAAAREAGRARMLENCDADGDGELSEEERQAAREARRARQQGRGRRGGRRGEGGEAMKAAERDVYITLADVINWTLCGFCKFSEGSACEGEGSCQHPLEIVADDVSSDLMMDGPGGDCWGYRPVLPVADIADIVGIILSEGWVVASYEPSKTGPIRVYGSKKSERLNSTRWQDMHDGGIYGETIY